MNVILYPPKYQLFEYEKSLAQREIVSLLEPESIIVDSDKIIATNCNKPEKAKWLVYSSEYELSGIHHQTIQAQRERSDINAKQNTRYYAHGIHEYKGKFNPQIVRAILNIFAHENDVVLDPFCGSGTSIFESIISNHSATGIDINPLASKISDIKTSLISNRVNFKNIDIDSLINDAKGLSKTYSPGNSSREIYLSHWFSPEYLSQIESLRLTISESFNDNTRELLLLIVSNILRDYSEQEPNDLRIRRRYSPYPDISFWDRFKNEYIKICEKITNLYNDQNIVDNRSFIVNDSINSFHLEQKELFDIAITSPPYALALPYIDTQRLSLVWYDLIQAKSIKEVECSLTGTREILNSEQRKSLLNSMLNNSSNLHTDISTLCLKLYKSLTEDDGFRKKDTPILLYQYFSNMAEMFSRVIELLRKGAYYCLVVGYNKTTIGHHGLIDTPGLLCKEAMRHGFTLIENTRLEAYPRYGINSNNSIDTEALIVLRK